MESSDCYCIDLDSKFEPLLPGDQPIYRRSFQQLLKPDFRRQRTQSWSSEMTSGQRDPPPVPPSTATSLQRAVSHCTDHHRQCEVKQWILSSLQPEVESSLSPKRLLRVNSARLQRANKIIPVEVHRSAPNRHCGINRSQNQDNTVVLSNQHDSSSTFSCSCQENHQQVWQQPQQQPQQERQNKQSTPRQQNETSQPEARRSLASINSIWTVNQEAPAMDDSNDPQRSPSKKTTLSTCNSLFSKSSDFKLNITRVAKVFQVSLLLPPGVKNSPKIVLIVSGVPVLEAG